MPYPQFRGEVYLGSWFQSIVGQLQWENGMEEGSRSCYGGWKAERKGGSERSGGYSFQVMPQQTASSYQVPPVAYLAVVDSGFIRYS